MAIGDLEGMGYIVHSYRVRLLSTKKKREHEQHCYGRLGRRGKKGIKTR